MEVQKSSSCCENLKNGNIAENFEQIPVSLKNSIKSIARKEGFLSYDIKTKKISNQGGNYMGVLYEIDIEGKTENHGKEVNLFVKYTIPGSERLSEMVSTSQAYINEVLVYKEMSKIFKQIEDKAGIPVEERYKMVKGYDESFSEAIIMENMAKKGFKCCDRMKVVPLKFVELSVQQLAKIHGLGFAIKKEMPAYYDKHLSKMKYIATFNDEWVHFFTSMSKISLKNVRDDLKQKAEAFVSRGIQTFEKYLMDTTTIKTLCHGDFRAGNILMKEVEGKVTEVIPVDFQVIHYGVPANELLYFIYGCTDGQFRKQHMKNILELYYDTLTSYLKYFDIDIADVYPKSIFEESLKARPNYGLIIALAFYPFYFAPEDNILDFSDQNLLSKDMNLSPEIIHRIEEIIEEEDVLGIL